MFNHTITNRGMEEIIWKISTTKSNNFVKGLVVAKNGAIYITEQ